MIIFTIPGWSNVQPGAGQMISLVDINDQPGWVIWAELFESDQPSPSAHQKTRRGFVETTVGDDGPFAGFPDEVDEWRQYQLIVQFVVAVGNQDGTAMEIVWDCVAELNPEQVERMVNRFS